MASDRSVAVARPVKRATMTIRATILRFGARFRAVALERCRVMLPISPW
jgi:hypothetical protein